VGQVYVIINGQYTELQKAQSLTEKSVISIKDKGQLILLNKTERKLCTFKDTGQGTISSLLSMQGNKTQDLNDSYFSYISEKIKSGDEGNQKNYMQSAGTSYRDGDSTLIENLFHGD
jgi:hypothetical protein